MFAEESVLVAQNWETVDDIMKAIEKLQTDITNLLYSIEDDLAQQPWWANGWHFHQQGAGQVFISNQRWLTDDDNDVLWIGVESVTPSKLFGLDPPPGLYVWVWNRQGWPNLGPELVQELSQSKYELIGELDTKQNAYVAREPLKKYRPSVDIETYGQEVKQEIIEFLSCYAPILLELDPIIQKHFKS